MLTRLVSLLRSIPFPGKELPIEEVMAHWVAESGDFFEGQFGEKIKWTSRFGEMATICGLPGSHGVSIMPNLENRIGEGDGAVTVGWVEGISMHSGGTVIIKHFALDTRLTHRSEGYGGILYEAILDLFRKHYAVAVEFHENHSSRIEHYRTFFSRRGVPEISDRVWRAELYPGQEIPDCTLRYQQELAKKANRAGQR